MSNNSFKFADELRVNSSLRRQFASLAISALDLDDDVQEVDDYLERYGAEDMVQRVLAEVPELMQYEFGVR